MKLSSLRPEHLECRSMGHAWTHVDDRDHFRDLRSREIIRFVRDERCLRCDAERSREIDLGHPTAVEVRTVRMRYPEGYVLREPRQRVTRSLALGAQYGREVTL